MILEHIHKISMIMSSVFALSFFILILFKVGNSFKKLKIKSIKDRYVSTNNHNKLLIYSYIFGIIKHLTIESFERSNFYSILINSFFIVLLYFLNKFFTKKDKERQESIVEEFNVKVDTIIT